MSEPNFALEAVLSRIHGCKAIAGIDEAGRGALAGPVVAAAVILPSDRPDLAWILREVRDSKELTPRKREELFDLVLDVALAVGVGSASNVEIDEWGIVGATRAAMIRALGELDVTPDALLIDYLRLPDVKMPQLAVPKGDRMSVSIAAASIIAKVSRDRLMVKMDETFPGYGFASHKGYGTRRHKDALRRLGPCRIHRLSFRPVAEAAMRHLERKSHTSG